MANLSAKAAASKQALRQASQDYLAIVEKVIENPRGQFVEKLREAEERVAEKAVRWALDYEEGVEPESSGNHHQ
jgi:23S rRNA-/tRNA-specific pseudouridylate synthase